MVNLQISKYKDPRDACAEIVAESYRLWLQYETRTDDITIIVVHINGLTDVWNYYFLFLLDCFHINCFIKFPEETSHVYSHCLT